MSQRDLYQRLTDLLTLQQYQQLMGGDMSYVAKAKRAKVISKAYKVHSLADQIIKLG